MTTQEVDDLRKELADLKSLVNRFLDAVYYASASDENLAGNLWRALYEVVENTPDGVFEKGIRNE